ncbi:MAG: adenosine kinase [Rhodospirillales bacterium]|jgi:sugar/nucleoside kinase (ribokinase family)|nr:adenosine kinase [Rhodospirillales bacterium]
MAHARYDVVGIGNAIVDVLAHADDAFIDAQGLIKGTMRLIDGETADRLYEAMGPAVEVSGGSAANTIAGLASLGGSGAFIGKVKADQLGQIFRHDIVSLGIAFPTRPAADGPATGRCLILVTPDAQRTMQTYLGACGELAPDDVDAEVIAAARITYLEGYLWDRPNARDAFIKAANIAHAAGRMVALSLSDPLCADRHRVDFLELIHHHVDVLFANEDEIVSLYREHSFDGALQRVRHHCAVAALTRSEKGSVVIAGDEVHVVDAEPVDHVVDSTGAGDAYAAGFLYGLTRGLRLETCARIGGIVAGEILSHFGARPETSLAELVNGRLG